MASFKSPLETGAEEEAELDEEESELLSPSSPEESGEE
jgi:hypothetical protein